MTVLAIPTHDFPRVSEAQVKPWEYGAVRPGSGAQGLLKKAREAFEHWSRRIEYTSVSDTLIDDDYRFVPLKPTRFVKTRYKRVGRLRPLPYPLDE